MTLASLQQRFSLLFVCALIFVASSQLWAQCSDSPFNKNGIKAHSIPISDTQIVFQITTPSGQIANMTVPEGGMAKAEDYHLGTTFAFVPVLQGKKQSVDFRVFLINEDKEGNESIRQVERITATIGEAALSQSQSNLQIRLININPPGTQASQPSHKTESAEIKIEMGPAVDCCVSCTGISACAGAVCIPGCGSCHDPGFPPIDCSQNSSSTNLPFDLNQHHSKLALSNKKAEPAQPVATEQR